MKHTKGPWTVGEDSELVAGCCTVETDSGSIAHVETWCMDGIALRDEAATNAHLIAAAPELLEACEKVLSSINANCICEQLHNDDAELLSEIMADVYGAITKATGR